MRRSTVVNVESDMGTPMVSEKQQAAAIFERRHVMQDRAGRCGQWDALRLAAFHAPGRGGQDHAIEVELVPSCAADLAAAGAVRMANMSALTPAFVAVTIASAITHRLSHGWNVG